MCEENNIMSEEKKHRMSLSKSASSAMILWTGWTLTFLTYSKNLRISHCQKIDDCDCFYLK